MTTSTYKYPPEYVQSTVLGDTSFGNLYNYQFYAPTIKPLTTDPISIESIGMIYFNSVDGGFRFWNGSTWEKIASTSASPSFTNVLISGTLGVVGNYTSTNGNITLTNGNFVATNGNATIGGTLGVTGISSLGTIATGLWNGTPITVPFGGTGLLTTTAYGILTGGTTATGNFQNAGTGASGTILQGGGASALPTFSTATYPSTTTVNQLLYSSATNTVSQITAAASSTLITNSSSVPSLSQTLPSAVQGNITSLGSLGALTVTGTSTLGVVNSGAITATSMAIDTQTDYVKLQFSTTTSGTQSLTSGSSAAVTTWLTSGVGTLGGFTHTTGIFQPVANGVYNFCFTGLFATATTGQASVQLLFNNNSGFQAGSPISGTSTFVSSTATAAISCSSYMSTSDTVTFKALQTSGGAINLTSAILFINKTN